MTDPRAVADYLAAMTEREFAAFAAAARDPSPQPTEHLQPQLTEQPTERTPS